MTWRDRVLVLIGAQRRNPSDTNDSPDGYKCKAPEATARLIGREFVSMP